LLLSFQSLVSAWSKIPDKAGLERRIRRANGSGKDDQGGRLIAVPAPPSYTGLKKIPDAAHPFIPPGPGDQRGPCPASNTLANHGYVNRTGIVTFEEYIFGAMEGFSMGQLLASHLVSFAVLTRGNANLGILSLGLEDDRVPTLPGNIDMERPGGLGKHLRFESDVSLTRNDHALGDSVNFNPDLFDMLLTYVDKYGDDGPEGPKSVVTQKVFEEYKYDSFMRFQQLDPVMQYHSGRQLAAFTESSEILNLFADGRTGNVTRSILTDFFQNQKFGDDWFRRDGLAEVDVLGPTLLAIRAAHPVPPGMNAPNGTYVPDVGNFSDPICAGYYDQAGLSPPAVLNTTTGIFKQNVDTMVAAMRKNFASCPTQAVFTGMAGI